VQGIPQSHPETLSPTDSSIGSLFVDYLFPNYVFNSLKTHVKFSTSGREFGTTNDCKVALFQYVNCHFD
jgi:hypothetical protein